QRRTPMRSADTEPFKAAPAHGCTRGGGGAGPGAEASADDRPVRSTRCAGAAITGREPADPPSALAGGEAGQQSAFMSALVTEHLVRRAAASTRVSEAAGGAALSLSVLSSSLVAMGFASQSAHRFALFAATAIPAVVVLGLFTTARLVDTGVQNVAFLAGIARIRGYHRTLPAGDAQHFAPRGQPSPAGIGQA